MHFPAYGWRQPVRDMQIKRGGFDGKDINDSQRTVTVVS